MLQDNQSEQIEKIMHWFRGNGEPGVFEKFRINESRLDEVERQVQEVHEVAAEARAIAQDVRKQYEEINNMLKGAKITLAVVLIVVTATGAVGGSWVFQALKELLTLVP